MKRKRFEKEKKQTNKQSQEYYTGDMQIKTSHVKRFFTTYTKSDSQCCINLVSLT